MHSKVFTRSSSRNDSIGSDCESLGFFCDTPSFTVHSSCYGGVRVIESSAVMFMDVSTAVEAVRNSKSMNSNSSNRITRPRSMQSMSSLDSIDEEKELEADKFISDHQVRLVSYIVAHDGILCSNFIAAHLHRKISEHPKFSSMANMPHILKDCFCEMDSLFFEYLEEKHIQDESGCSIAIAIINQKDEVCMGYIGDVRAIVQGVDGKVFDLAKGHIIDASDVERARLRKNEIDISSDGKIFGKYHYGRAFGHRAAKKFREGGLICLPHVIHIQINSSSKTSPTSATTPSMERLASVNRSRGMHHYRRHSSSLSKSSDDSLGSSRRYHILMVFGMSTAWSSTYDKKLCKTLHSSLQKGVNVAENGLKIIDHTWSQPMSNKHNSKHGYSFERGHGICILDWVR